MRITRRTSGGRGEYEISESSPEGLTPADLFDRRLILEIETGWTLDTTAVLRHQGGKRRIRRLPGCEMHPHLQLAAALLMPAPVRANEAQGAGTPVMRRYRYAIEHIFLDSASLQGTTTVRLRATEVIVRNATIPREELGLNRRVAQLKSVWDQSAALPQPIRVLLDSHRLLAQGGGPLLRNAQKLVGELQVAVSQNSTEIGVFYDGITDVLPALADALQMEVPEEPPPPLSEVPLQEVEIRRRRAKEWRQWAARRGPLSARFRRAVQLAYNFTCIVCGARFPATDVNRKPGVDSAHILAWAEYDLDMESNGLCLCKLHHWAFDEGLIEVYYEDGNYGVRISPGVADTANTVAGGFTLAVLEQHAGDIPLSRLPANPHHRPHPQFLQRLKQDTGG